MDINFKNIDYLNNGNAKQRLAYTTLIKNGILTDLQQFDPILVGTIPINIDIENSDLDIICYYQDKDLFIKIIKNRFYDFRHFQIREFNDQENNTVVANFSVDNFEIEIFGQNIPTMQQYAYRHMVIEYKLLCEQDEAFRQKIIDLKRQGYKTEVAFGMVLKLTGNPYLELLKYEN